MGARLVVTNQLGLDDAQLGQVDRVILYARPVIERQRPALRDRAVFAYLPADGDFEAARRAATQRDSVFTGGGADRDFHSLIEAMRGLDAQLEIVTFSPETLRYDVELPENCSVHWRIPLPAFLERMAGGLFVVVPLRDPESSFGQTTDRPGARARQGGRGHPQPECSRLRARTGRRDSSSKRATSSGTVTPSRGWRAMKSFAARSRRTPARRQSSLTYPVFGATLEALCEALVRTV